MRKRLRVRYGNAVIEGRLPSLRLLQLLVRAGLGVHVLRMPEGERTLAFLAPLGPSLRKLVITDHQCEDMSAVAALSGLEELALTPAPAGAPGTLKGLPRLRKYAGPWSETLGPVLASDSLVDLTLERPPRDLAGRLTAPLQTLRVLSARKLTALPDLACRSTLQMCEIAGGRDLDLAGIERYRQLQHLKIYGRTPVTSSIALTQCVALRRLHLEECYRLDDPSALEALKLDEFLLVGRPESFDPEVLTRAHRVRARKLDLPREPH